MALDMVVEQEKGDWFYGCGLKLVDYNLRETASFGDKEGRKMGRERELLCYVTVIKMDPVSVKGHNHCSREQELSRADSGGTGW